MSKEALKGRKPDRGGIRGGGGPPPNLLFGVSAPPVSSGFIKASWFAVLAPPLAPHQTGEKRVQSAGATGCLLAKLAG